MWASEVCFACLTCLYGLFVRTLISRTIAYAGCGRPTQNFLESFDLGRSVPTLRVSRPHVTFDEEVDLNDDAVGRSRYERF